MKKSHILAFVSGAIIAGVVVYWLMRQQIANQKPPEPIIKTEIVYKCPEAPKPAEIPILPPPEFTKAMPQKFQASPQGELQVAWTGVKDSRAYQVRVYDLNGKQVKSWRTGHEMIYLRSLPFEERLPVTAYEIALATINKKNVAGPESKRRALNVIHRSNLMAPKIDSITVED